MTPAQTHSSAQRVIAEVGTYAEAQSIVDWLADRAYPVEHISIVGRDLRMVERVTGRLTLARAALGGAASGVLFGALFGALFGVLFTYDGVSYITVVLYWLAVGAAAGVLFGLLTYALSRDRSFTSDAGVRAARYDVVVDEAFADDATRLLTDRGKRPERTS